MRGVRTSPSGVPLLNDMLSRVRASSRTPLLAFVNADIVLGPSFGRAMEAVCAVFDEGTPFLVIGRRFDVSLEAPLDFDDPAWVDRLDAAAAAPGAHMQNELYKDYFVFSRSLWGDADVPPLTVGRAAVDDWIVKSGLLRGPVVDISLAVPAFHANHSYWHVAGGQEVRAMPGCCAPTLSLSLCYLS